MSPTRIFALMLRLLRQVVRDRRLLAMMFVAPTIVMVLVALVVRQDDKVYSLGLDARGPMSLFIGDMRETLQRAGFRVEELMPEDDARALVRTRALDGVLVIDEQFLVDRAQGKAGKMSLLVEGADPMAEIGLAGDLREAVADMVHGLPVLLDSACPRECAVGVNTTPPDLDVDRLVGAKLDMVDFFMPGIIPLVAFFFGYLLTALSFLRERSGGTLERLLASPITRGEIVVGYFLAFSLFGLLQAVVIVGLAVGPLAVPNQAGLVPLFGLVVLTVATAAGVGLFLSTFAKAEIQVAQFIPLVILPQFFVCGLIWPVADLPSYLRPVAWAMPLTHATAAARELMIRGDLAAAMPPALGLAGFCLGAVILAVLTMRRNII